MLCEKHDEWNYEYGLIYTFAIYSELCLRISALRMILPALNWCL